MKQHENAGHHGPTASETLNGDRDVRNEGRARCRSAKAAPDGQRRGDQDGGDRQDRSSPKDFALELCGTRAGPDEARATASGGAGRVKVVEMTGIAGDADEVDCGDDSDDEDVEVDEGYQHVPMHQEEACIGRQVPKPRRDEGWR